MVVTDEIIRSLSSPQSFERGLEPYRSGTLFALARQGNLLLGKCEGTSAPVYDLQAQIDAGDVRSALCSCPYDFGGLCKHLVALLLASIRIPDDFSVRKPVHELLDDLDSAALVQLLENTVESDPGLYDRLEMAVAAGKTGKAGSRPTLERRKTVVSEATYRSKVKNILRSLNGYRMSEAYWMMGGMVDELRMVEADQNKWNYLRVEKVAEAVLVHRPEWVIRVCISQSDGLIASTKSKYYAAAARWLQRAKQAYIRMGRQAEWQNYLNGLKAQYSRRPALQAELRKL